MRLVITASHGTFWAALEMKSAYTWIADFEVLGRLYVFNRMLF